MIHLCVAHLLVVLTDGTPCQPQETSGYIEGTPTTSTVHSYQFRVRDRARVRIRVRIMVLRVKFIGISVTSHLLAPST